VWVDDGFGDCRAFPVRVRPPELRRNKNAVRAVKTITENKHTNKLEHIENGFALGRFLFQEKAARNISGDLHIQGTLRTEIR
ncbi:hypothetical protein, partial [Bilophila sp. 4_1_30]|uniref:hypothetical protein n=1 Tax=Bilophila sp. 4_1_30 TaxID=693988 RepID=UPI001E59D7B8